MFCPCTILPSQVSSRFLDLWQAIDKYNFFTRCFMHCYHFVLARVCCSIHIVFITCIGSYKPTLVSYPDCNSKYHQTTYCTAVETAFYDHPLVQQKTVLKGRWSVKRESLRHAHAKSILFFSSNSKRKVYTLISYIFAVQSLHKRWLQAYTSVQQGTCVLYCGPILRYFYM